jgi:hypothetical protein
LGRIALGQGVKPRSGVGVNTETRRLFPLQVIQTVQQNRVFKNIRRIPRMKGVPVT